MWGGNKLKSVLNKDYQEEHIGESWEISDVKGDESKVLNGDLKGYTLKQLIKEYKADFLGQHVLDNFGEEFPLLIKYIDAETPLSIQVHPHDDIAKERHNSFGKNEMWYIMDADESAEIIVGFNKTTDPETYSEALKNGKLLDILNKEKTKTGDTFYIPTGRVHAIGAGVMLAEIQQTSDITYRIYDYNRVDKSTGKKRDLHTDLALDVIDFEAHDSYKTTYNREINTSNTLVHSPYFKTDFLCIDGELERDYSNLDSFIILMCANGKAEVSYLQQNYVLPKGSTILIPAAIKNIKIKADVITEVLEIYL
jgi:mannose-6-phosphate isomerase